MTDFITKDSGERAQFDSGMQRDTEAGKPRFDLLIPDGVPYEDQLLTRFAALMGRGAEKYEDRNWEKANSQAEINRARSSAFRHFMQWFCGEGDEDHAVATIFNIMVVETVKPRVEQVDEEEPDGDVFVTANVSQPPNQAAVLLHEHLNKDLLRKRSGIPRENLRF